VWYSLNREVDSFLEGEVREFVGVVQEHQFNFSKAQQVIRQHLGSRTRIDLTFRILDQHGVPLLQSHAHDLIPDGHTVPGSPASYKSMVHFQTLHVPGQSCPLRVCSVPIQGPAGSVLIAQASYTLDRVSASLSMFRTVSAVALLAAIILSAVGGRILAQRSLKPLHEMIQTAQRISAHHISERLPRTHSGDELDRLAETLNGLLDRIQRYVSRLQQFTADASHELRSPLAALQGAGEVALSRERSADELRQVIELSLEHYQRLRRITEDLLLLARVDAGEEVFRREPVRLDSAIEDVVDLFVPLANDRNIELTFTEHEPATVIGDSGRLRQLMANLIDNAVKYTNGPGTILVSLTSENGSVRIQVCDTGIGIPAENLPHIFDRFYRIDSARPKSSGTGAGLGLAICRSIVEGHGGSIALAPGPTEGTVASVELPLAEVS